MMCNDKKGYVYDLADNRVLINNIIYKTSELRTLLVPILL